MRVWILSCVCLFLAGCGTTTTEASPESKSVEKIRPVFSADSAYAYIERQVAFGPRVPGTISHVDCGDWLVNELHRHGLYVEVQKGTMLNYAGEDQEISNIVGFFEGSIAKTVLLCAHWDTRPWSDEEESYDQRFQPVLGANDGASGVGVVLEIVRQLNLLKSQGELVPSIQVVFFDCEDMGTPTHFTGQERQDTWCLGSQLWAKEYKRSTLNSQRSTLNYQYGILLDMVGDAAATFPREYFSVKYAGGYVEQLWRKAYDLGYSRYFTQGQTYYPITDDHYYVNTLAGIPCLDIIDYRTNSRTGFPQWWHTQQDDMRNINKQTLQAVGETVLATICLK